MRKKGLLVLAVCFALGMFSACTGPQGPTGPTGPTGATGADGVDGADGSVTQTTYVFDITPGASSGTATVSCPAIVANHTTNTYSTVECYLHWSGYDDAPALPYQDTEGDTTETNYFYSIDTSGVTLGWVNSATTIPQPFELIVTVLN